MVTNSRSVPSFSDDRHTPSRWGHAKTDSGVQIGPSETAWQPPSRIKVAANVMSLIKPPSTPTRARAKLGRSPFDDRRVSAPSGENVRQALGLMVGVIAGAHQRAALNDAEAAAQALGLELVELLGGHPAVDGQAVARGLEVLADGEDGAPSPTALRARRLLNLFHQGQDFIVALADADHDAGLGDASLLLDAAEELQRAVELGAGADGGVHAADGLEVVVDDVGAGVDHHLEGGPVALEIGDEDLDRHTGAGLAGADDRFGPDGGAAVGQLVAADAGDDDVAR